MSAQKVEPMEDVEELVHKLNVVARSPDCPDLGTARDGSDLFRQLFWSICLLEDFAIKLHPKANKTRHIRCVR